ncbi:MAG: hypothetical protein HUK25_08545 [Treponema sp.]|nr:hypothetical protein [Treponema sp.]
MGQTELQLRGIELKLDRLLDMLQLQKDELKNEEKVNQIESEWITLTQACQMHGGYKLSTLRARLDLQPKNGIGTMIGKNKCWRKADILEWLSVTTPQERKAYQKKYSKSVS